MTEKGRGLTSIVLVFHLFLLPINLRSSYHSLHFKDKETYVQKSHTGCEKKGQDLNLNLPFPLLPIHCLGN